MGRRTGALGLFSRAITQQPYGSTAIHQTRLPVSGWPWTGLDIASAPVVHVGEEGGAAKRAARIRRLANHGPAGKRRGTPWCNHSPTALLGQTRKEEGKK